MARRTKKSARIRVAGPDHKGIIARVTTFLFENNINIEDIDQRILEGFLVMNMLVDLSDYQGPLTTLRKQLKKVGGTIDMETELKEVKAKRIKNAALLVTKEPHCLEALVRKMRSGNIRAVPQVILSNHQDLAPLAKKLKIPFYWYPADKKKTHEERLYKHIDAIEADVVVLARYMQILSPDFCFRYEGRIINIHPSLLPAFPGALPYAQAYNKGVEVAGVTAHFATTDLDQGPIICQGAFRVDKVRDTIPDLTKKGQKLEAEVLCRAVKLFCDDQLVLRRGKVVHSRREHAIEAKAKSWG